MKSVGTLKNIPSISDYQPYMFHVVYNIHAVLDRLRLQFNRIGPTPTVRCYQELGRPNETGLY